MGWGEPMRPKSGVALAEAVRQYLALPTTRNRDRLAEALQDFELEAAMT